VTRTVPVADYDRVRDELVIAVAEISALLLALRDVMACASKQATSPAEHKVNSIALAALARHGMDPGAATRERMEIASAEWRRRR
jgi:hypothetical protein